MMPLKHNSTDGKLNKARLARLIAERLFKTSYIGDVFEDTNQNPYIKENTMANKKKTEGTNNDLESIHIELKIE
jgi:hypothetical protein